MKCCPTSGKSRISSPARRISRRRRRAARRGAARHWEILDAWRDAAAECGIPKIKEFNRGDNFGNAYFHMNQKRGRRWRARQRLSAPRPFPPQLSVITQAMVKRVRIELHKAERATGIEFAHPQRGEAAPQAQRETILAAGSIGSPQLLQTIGRRAGDAASGGRASSRA